MCIKYININKCMYLYNTYLFFYSKKLCLSQINYISSITFIDIAKFMVNLFGFYDYQIYCCISRSSSQIFAITRKNHTVYPIYVYIYIYLMKKD